MSFNPFWTKSHIQQTEFLKNYYEIQHPNYKKDFELWEKTHKYELTSSTNGETCGTNSSLPDWWLLKSVKPLDFRKGYLIQRKAGDYLERRVTNYKQEGGFIRKLPYVYDFHEDMGLVYYMPYILKKDIELDENNQPFYPPDKIKFMKSHAENRMLNPRQVLKLCNDFKWLVRANEKKIRLMLTLTYAENMQDTSRLYEDFRKFWMVLKYNYPQISGYLVAFEPQQRGSWHAHVLLVSESFNLYISNKVIHKMWGYGFTKTQRPQSIRDIANYLSAYLTNVKKGAKSKKGARLYLYPAYFHFLRHSINGIDKVSTYKTLYDEGKFYYGTLGKFKNYTLLYDYEFTTTLSRDSSIVKQTKIVCLKRTN